MALFRNFLRDGLPFVCAAALILASQRTEGQVPSGQTQDRAQLLGGQANPTVPNVTPSGENQGYAVASPNEKDIGEQQILKRMEEYRPFTVSDRPGPAGLRRRCSEPELLRESRPTAAK